MTPLSFARSLVLLALSTVLLALACSIASAGLPWPPPADDGVRLEPDARLDARDGTDAIAVARPA